VTFARALAHAGWTDARGFADPTARQLLPPAWVAKLDALMARGGGRWRRALKRMADLLALRTMAIDAAARDAVAGGARQLVILGAGLDGRAFRMPELADTDVFEVDHPATQATKRARAAALPVKARSLQFVAVDFERDALADRLAAAGHRPGEPTVWIWEGVVMYLRDEAVRATLAAIAARSARGSTLAVQYNTRQGVDLCSRMLLRLLGEPQVGLRSPQQMAAELTAAGFRVAADSGTADWASRFLATAPASNAGRRARLVVAQR
jgi:methyltransferase (TIGR00027 family)